MSSLYNTGRIGFLTEVEVGSETETIDWVADDIYVALLDNTYGYGANDTSYAAIETSIVTNGDVIIPGRAVNVDGAATADNVTFSAVTGNTVTQAVIYKRVGATEADWPLIAHLDSGTGLPIVPNGGDITLIWGGGGGEIFRL